MRHINFIFVLIILLTACTPNATLAPLPTVTSSPVLSETVVAIDTHPAGFDRAPTDPSSSSSELFVALTIQDVGKSAGGETPIPEQIKDQVAKIKAEMEKEKEKVANICGVPVAKTNVVFKAGSIDNQVPWTVLYEAVIPAGQDIPAGVYTCWTREENGSLNTYPTVWDNNGKLQITEGNCFERLEGEMKWAGTTPVIYDPRKHKFTFPGGRTYDAFLMESSWSSLETASTTEIINLVTNPFSPENMNILATGGYRWDAITGSLINADGNTALTLQDGKWFDGSGVEISLESLKVIETNGVDFEGRPLAILSFDVNGEKRVSLPSGESAAPIDLTASRALVDENAMTNPTSESWGTYEGMTFDRMPIVTQASVDSGLLFLSRAMILRAWPTDVRVPVWRYVPGNTEAGKWKLTEYRDESGELGNYTGGSKQFPGEDPIVWKNDAMINSDVVRYLDESTGLWVINSGVQLYYEGDSLIFNVEYEGKDADPNDPDFFNTQMAIGNPAWTLVTFFVNDSEVTKLLPPDLQAKMQELEGKPMVDSDTSGTFLAGSELTKFQEYTLVPNSFRQRLMHWYLLDENHPLFDSKYPDKP